jgi:hypothetical protein
VTPEGQALYDRNDWSLLPFMALSDGAHMMLEDFSYFTLLDKAVSPSPDAQPQPTAPADGKEATTVAESQPSTITSTSANANEYVPAPGDSSLFGIACTRQIRADRLKRRSADVTRSSVQKAVVVVVKDVRGLGELRTRLGMVTEAWFGQEYVLSHFILTMVDLSREG